MTARHSLFLAALALGLPRYGRAEDSLAYKYEDYREADGRVAVQTESAAATQDIGTDMMIKLTGTIDTIAGATPTGVPAPAGGQLPMDITRDRRKAWTGDFSDQISSVNVDAGFAYSRESDYTSHAYSINTVTDFNQKNTELLTGAAINQDYVHVLIQGGSPWRNKYGGDGILGVTQILDPNTTITFSVSWGRSTGFNSDQYKVVQKSVPIFGTIVLPEIFAENRPNVRDKGSALLALNHAFPRLNAAIDASYRYYGDTYGIAAHTAELAWLQHLTSDLIIEPSFRFYQQQAAKFYYYNLDQTNITPATVPNGTGVSYSSDYRLSALRSYTGGLKAIWKFEPWAELTLAFDRYQMEGMDNATPQSAYIRAKISTAGLKFTW